MLEKPMADLLQGMTGLSQEEINTIHPGLEKFFKNIPKTSQFLTVAEVVASRACSAGVQVGDRLVFDPFLNTEKSKGVMCPKALLPVLIQINSIWEMSPEWAESGKEEPPEIVFRNVRCLDPGFENGGIGGVIYRLRLEKRCDD